MARGKNHLTQDFWITVGIVISASIVSFFTHAGLLVSSILILLTPSIYLIVVKPKSLRRIFTMSLVGILIGVVFDLLGSWNKAWINTAVIPYKLFGIVTIDGIIWFFSWLLFIVTFYEHFLDHDRSKKVSPHFKFALIAIIIIFSTVTILFGLNPSLLKIPYTYLTLIVIICPFPAYFIFSHPKLLMKFIKTNLFFIFVCIFFEFIGLHNHQWVFQGHYITSFDFYSYVIPLEELIFWIGCSTSIVLSYYEFFVDDEK